MYIVTVAPIARGIPIDELSYFSREEVEPGSLVSVPLRGKSVSALVIKTLPAAEAKAELKRADFTLKKLERIQTKAFFAPAFVLAAEDAAKFYGATTGAVIQAVFPNVILKKYPRSAPRPSAKRFGEVQIFQTEEMERLATYKSHIREVFARGSSCYFVLPSVQDIEHTYEHLEKGIKEYTIILHSGLSKKTLIERWEKIATLPHPVLIIATPFFLAIPRNDIGSIILDRESSSAYMRQGRPYIDLRYFVERFAKHSGADLILGDLFLRVETLARKEAGEIEALVRPKYRMPSPARQSVVDMRTSGEQPAAGKVAIFSGKLAERIEETRQKGAHTFILGVRKGYAPMTVCGDCGTVIPCSECSAPLVLHKNSQKTAAPVGEGLDNDLVPETRESPQFIFLCHRCGKEAPTDRMCDHCGSWKLTPLGIGVEHAEQALAGRFPDAKILRLDRDSVGSHRESVAVVDEFYRTPGSILIGTEMALPYLTQPIALTAVLSVNSLLTIPDFRIGERVFRLLLAVREKASEHFIVQTRDPENPLFALAAEGNIGDFLRGELEMRKRLSYPPYSVLLKFTHEGKKQEGGDVLREIEQIFGAYHPVIFPSFIARVKGKYRMNALMKIPPKDWPSVELLSLIRSLPPEVEVRVNPESVI